MRRTLALAAILGAAWAAVAAADGGGPSPGPTWGSPGLVDHISGVRYVALGPLGRGCVDGLGLGAQRAGTRPVDRVVDDDPVQPRPERTAAVEPIQRPHGREKGLLGDVLGRPRVADDQVRRAVGRPPVRAEERLEIRDRPGLGPPHPGPLVAAGARHGVPTIRAA